MTDVAPDVSVVICAYTEERWPDLLAAVESVQRQSIPALEIIVVIDHNAPLRARAHTHLARAIVIENSQPRGLSGARNSGIAIARGAFIAFLDDDAVAEPDWLEHLATCCQAPHVMGAGGIVQPLWTSKRPAWFPQEFYWVIGCTYQSMPKNPQRVRNLYGGCTCMSRDVFQAVGGFKNGIGRVGTHPLGGEETELCIRAAQHWPQRVFLCEPRARIQHRIPPQRASWRYFRARCFAEGLSKAMIARVVGSKDALATERSYTLHTLSLGILRGVADALLCFELAGFLRAGAIVAGFAITATGYVVGTLSAHANKRQTRL
ncbi:MAG: glycosyltransferase [Chloroflexota bacterium]|nr:glycosyltransferase [Chloroflexota bacterium]